METLSKGKRKRTSSRLEEVYAIAGRRGPRNVVKHAFTVPVLQVIQAQYGDILINLGEICQNVPVGEKDGIWIASNNPRWKECGFDSLTGEECVLIRRLCEKDGYPIGFTRDGLICPPKIENIRPFTFFAQAS